MDNKFVRNLAVSIKKRAIIIFALIALGSFLVIRSAAAPSVLPELHIPRTALWEVTAIDTMKFSRDRARAALYDISFIEIIESQVAAIAATGASHIAIGTPYDLEFLPVLRRWVSSARANNLAVWFRGNWSGWEGWFDYPRINRGQHIERTKQFIMDNSDLFADGDIFSPCPECENGGPGDPRFNHDVSGHRSFLIRLHQESQIAFQEIDIPVAVLGSSMNGDVARLIMNPATTVALGGQVALDHYVRDPSQLAEDIMNQAYASQGTIILGEIGVPIPDIHGPMSESEQAAWLQDALNQLATIRSLDGINYWVGFGGSTALWNDDASPRQAVSILKDFYQPKSIYGLITDEVNAPIPNARIQSNIRQIRTTNFGYYELPLLHSGITELVVQADGYEGKIVRVQAADKQLNIQLKPLKKTWLYSLQKLVF